MCTPRLILCETTSRWAVAFRRAIGKRSNVVYETRSLAECGRELATAPASLVAVEATSENLAAVVAAAVGWSRRFPSARTLAMASRAPVETELVLREAGVVAVLRSTREARAAARLVLRHLSRAPVAEMSLLESIFKRLPWARLPAATT
jgi:hypothetical protein